MENSFGISRCNGDLENVCHEGTKADRLYVQEMAMNKDMKILIVDDFATMRKVIRNLLKQAGYINIVEAEDGMVALKELKSQKIGFVISDWNMEPMTGLELLKKVRDSGNQVPFIMVTAESKTENVIAAKQAGVNNYIVKPLSK